MVALSWKWRAAAVLAAVLCASPALAQNTGGGFVAGAESREVARFRWLDKITGKIESVDVLVGESRVLGGLRVAPQVCYGQPPTARADTWVFVQIDEQLPGGQVARVFSGWMTAESPGLNGLQHAVYDVWLEACRPLALYVDPDAPAAAPQLGPIMIDGMPTPRPRPSATPDPVALPSGSLRDGLPDGPMLD